MQLDIAAVFLKDVASAAEEELKRLKKKDEDDKLKGEITSIPPCILNCLYDRFLLNGCAYNNYFCFCAQMTSSLLELPVLECMKKCPYNEEVIYAKVSITDFCEVHGDGDTEFLFPWFLLEHESNRRALVSGSAGPPAPTDYTTVTSTLPWGVVAYTSTRDVGSDGTATVVYYAQDTVILTTFFVTTTIPASDTPYILTFTDKKSAAITEVIGVNAASKSSEPSTSSPPLTSSSQDSTSSLNTSPSNPSSANSSGGLSSGAKIGIGIAIPLVFIALAVVGTLFFLRRRKRARQTRPQPQETHDGGLPEPASTINVLEKFKEYPPSYRGPHVEAGGAPIAEMNQDQQRSDGTGSSLLFSHELNAAQQGQRQDLSSSPLPELNANQQRYEASGNHMTSDQELSADQARYEVSGNPAQVGHELSTQPHTPSPIPTLPVFSPTKEPVPVRTASPGPSSSFPPPWDSTGTAEYERKLNIGPAEAAAAEDQDLRELEEEVARVKMQKQRLQELQALEAREEELRRSIVERKKITAKGKV